MYSFVVKPFTFDLWMMGKLTRALGRYPRFDLAVEALTSVGILGGLGFAAVLFWLWTEAQNSGREALRRLVFRAILAMIIAGVVSVAAGEVLRWVPPNQHPALHQLYPGYLERNPNQSSFPSQSTAVCSAIAASLYSVNPLLGCILWAGVGLLVAAPRVYLGGHYPTDIVAGLACGMAGHLMAGRLQPFLHRLDSLGRKPQYAWIAPFIVFVVVVQLSTDFKYVGPLLGTYSTAVSPHSLRIGGDSHFGQYFTGMIDEVKIYDRALSPAEVQHDMVTPIRSASDDHASTRGVARGPVAAFACDEGSGQELFDSSGHGHNGVLQGVSWSAIGKHGKALLFDGQSSVEVKDSPALHLATAFTMEAWVYPTGVISGWSDIIHKEIDSYYLAASSNRGTPAAGGDFAGRGQNTYAPDPLPQNTWTHLAAIYDGRTLRLLINGKEPAAH